MKLLYQMRSMWIMNVGKLMRPRIRKTLQEKRSLRTAVIGRRADGRAKKKKKKRKKNGT